MEHDGSAQGGHALEEAAHGAGLPQLDFSTWPSQIFWLIVALVVLYAVLSRYVLPVIASTLQGRQDAIAGDLDMAAEYDRKANEARTALAENMEKARAEARRVTEQNQSQIRERLEAALAQADARIAKRAEESRGRIRAIEAESRTEAAGLAFNATVGILNRFCPSFTDADTIRAAVESHLTERGRA